jgi:hypothetical protein
MIKKTDRVVDTLKDCKRDIVAYELSISGESYGLLNVELTGTLGVIHCLITRWDKETKIETQKDWEIIKNDLRSMGLKNLICRKRYPDDKFESFITKFGFNKPVILMISGRDL